MMMQHLHLNTTLQGGKYRIERVLGQGGFGITYLATQISLNRKVAIKEFFMKDFCSRNETTRTISAPSTGSGKLVEQYRKKFIKEARNLARLSHPNIINVIDVFEENDTVYYVMPYLAGGSLQDYVKKHGVLSEQEAMKCVKQIASALKYMHEEQHICHYDVKPANILLDDNGQAVLIDFGISKNYDAQGQETTATPVGVSDGYAPIEQYQQNVEGFSPVSDVYALGATLYFLLHGKRPVSAVNRANGTALLMSIHLSQGIKDIINASMKISKHERANNVDVFLKEDYFLETTQGPIDTSTTDKSWSSLKKIAGVFFAILIFIFVGLVLPAIVYFGGGWIAKGIYYSIKPIESSMTLRDIYNQELWIYGIVAYLYFAIAEIIRDSDDNDYVFLGASAALACLCIFFCYILPMSDIAALLYSIIWICIMGGYGIKKLID